MCIHIRIYYIYVNVICVFAFAPTWYHANGYSKKHSNAVIRHHINTTLHILIYVTWCRSIYHVYIYSYVINGFSKYKIHLELPLLNSSQLNSASNKVQKKIQLLWCGNVPLNHSLHGKLKNGICWWQCRWEIQHTCQGSIETSRVTLSWEHPNWGPGL